MKGLKYSKKLKDEATVFTQMIELYCDKINKEYQKQMHTLLETIANGEGLDLAMLQKKYLKKLKQTEDSSIEILNKNEQILDKITFKNKTYYVDKNDNNVFDTSSNIVGKYNNNNIEFTML